MAVRREAVRLVLEDSGFSTGMAKNAAATALLGRQLDSLSGSAVRTRRDLPAVSQETDRVGTSARRAGPEIDRLSGRLRLIADAAAILGPSLVPIGAVAIPALTGLAAQMGAAALGAGTVIAAFQGVGDALKAVNEAALEPSTANLEKARLALAQLSPEARNLVRQIQEMRPAFDALRDSAAAGLFPGVSSLLGDLDAVLPRVESILFAIGDAAGDMAADLGESLSGERWQRFLRFIEAEVPSALTELGHTVGNVASGLAELWQAFTPLNRDFSGWLLDASRGFDDWAQGLAQTQGFQDFVDYIRTNGPRVADALGSIGNAVLQIVEAAAPLGGPTLQALAAVADVIAAIAGSDAGPAIMATVTALALLRRGMQTFSAISTSTWAQSVRGAKGLHAQVATLRKTAVRGAGALAGLSIAASGVADNFGLANAATGALMGAMAGPWGALIGGGVGLLMDFASAGGDAAERVRALTDALESGGAAAARTSIIEALESEGILEDADNLGLALDTVTAAAMGNKDALADLRAEQAAFKDAQRATTDEFGFDRPGVDADKAREDAAAIDHVISAITGENEALNEARGSAERKRAANQGLADSYNQTTGAAERFRNAVLAANKALSRDQSLIDYERSLDEARKTLRQNGRTLDITTEKGRQNKEALIGIAQSALSVAENMRKSNRVPFLRQARGDIVDAATKLGMTRGEARALADRLLGLDKMRVKPKIDADTAEASRKIGQIQYQLQQLDGDRVTTYVDTVYTASGKRFKDVPASGSADGGTVPKTGLHYADRHPYLLADGEEVISNRYGQADRHRELLKAINANRLADGGTVGRSLVASGPATSVSVNLDGLRVTGILQTPWGPSQIEGIARSAARAEIDNADGFRRTLEGDR